MLVSTLLLLVHACVDLGGDGLCSGASGGGGGGQPATRGSHSFTSQLNLSAAYGIGGTRSECAARVKGVLSGVQIV